MPTSESARAATPTPARVHGNRWDEIQVPELGKWSPTERVSVILPYYNAPDALIMTLAGLAEQTYPGPLLQVVVVDDGSEMPPKQPDFDHRFELEVVTQERRGFGLARARNLGARVSDNEVLIFLDCDMVPERWFVEAHARWHAQASDIITIGSRRHAPFGSKDVDQLRIKVRTDLISELFEAEEIGRPQWIEDHLQRTDLLRLGSDAYKVMSGGNLGIRRTFFLEIGGNDEGFQQWGGEDNEFGFRAFQQAAIVVPEQRAIAWHQGEGVVPSEEEYRSLIEQRPKLRQLVADPGFRPPVPGRSYRVPTATITLRVVEELGDDVVRAVESILASRFHDLVVVLALPDGHTDATRITREFDGDPRVLVASDPAATESHFPYSPVRIGTSPCLFGETTMDKILRTLEAEGLGALYLTVPDGNGALVEVRTTRALTRARRLATTREDRDRMIADLFGEEWMAGADLGLLPLHAVNPQPSTSPPQDPQVLELRGEVERLHLLVMRMKERRAVRLADSVGRLRRRLAIRGKPGI